MPDAPLGFLSYPAEGDTSWFTDAEEWFKMMEVLGVPTYQDKASFPTPPPVEQGEHEGDRNHNQFLASKDERTVYRWDSVDDEWEPYFGAGTSDDPHPEKWVQLLNNADIPNAPEGSMLFRSGTGDDLEFRHVVDYVAYEPGFVSWDSSLDWDAVHRFRTHNTIQSDEDHIFVVTKVQFERRSGESDEDANLRIRDTSNGATVADVSHGGQSYDDVGTETNADVDLEIQIQNNTSSAVVGAPCVRGYIRRDYV